MRIDGKVAVITGASEGIGAACAKLLAQKGARVVLNARRADRLQQAAPPGAVTVPGDITQDSTRQRLIAAAQDSFGGIDILINNAGRGLYQPSHLSDLDLVRQLWELNFFAPLALTQLAVARMKQRGGGCVVNVGSVGGKVTLPWMTLYSASKYALGSFTDGLRMELKHHNIHAITVCPCYVYTGFQQNVLAGAPPQQVQKSKAFRVSADECAADIVRGIERDARTVISPWAGWLYVAAERLFPSLVDARMTAMYQELRQQSAPALPPQGGPQS